MQTFAMRFSQNSTESLILSPLPANQKHKLLSPMKVSENRQIFIHAMEPRDHLTSPGAAIYLLNNSPRKQVINLTLFQNLDLCACVCMCVSEANYNHNIICLLSQLMIIIFG